MTGKRCPTCGNGFTPRRPFQKYCGPRCASKTSRCTICSKPVDYRATTCNAHHWTPKREARKRLCTQCGSEFYPTPTAILRSAAKFCSSRCYFASVADRPAFIEVSCTQCGGTFRRTRAAVARVKAAFCSPGCSREYLSGERHHSYRGGERHRRGPGWEVNRRQCRARDQVCRSCGKTPTDNGQQLSVDHVIPWRIFTDERVANDLRNLVALCRSCHAKKTGRAEQAYMRGDVLDWLTFLRDVQIDPASLNFFDPYLQVESVA